VAAKPADETAMAFLNMAREYQDAADELFAISERRDRVVPNYRPLSSPLSILYFHTLELGLKAFLRAHGLPIEGTARKSHNLKELYDECKALGLAVDQDDRVGLQNIVGLLESGNERQGFRYFSSGSTVTADLAWTRDVIQRSIVAIARQVEERDPNAHDPPRLAKMIVIVKVT
jgi:hypothetical protein